MSDDPAQPLPASTPAPAGRSLTEAVVTGLILLGLIIIAAFIGVTAFFVLAFVVVMAAQFELLDALKKAGHRPVIPFGLLCGAAMLVVAYSEKTRFFALVLIGTVVGSFVLALRPQRGTTAMSDVAWTILSVAWITGGGASAILLLRLDHGIGLIASFVLITALDDIGAYFVGTRLGRHKMAPSISPAKSWEGFAGGFVTALLGGVLFGNVLDSLSLVDGLALGVIAGFFAPVGDLVESVAKREIGIKDSGTWLPGHGGFLDRLDAIIFCAPLAFLYIRYLAG